LVTGALFGNKVSPAGIDIPAIHSLAGRIFLGAAGVLLVAASVVKVGAPTDIDNVEERQLTGDQRRQLIAKVRKQRIVNGLDRSLGQAAEMTLGLRDSSDLVSLEYLTTPAGMWAPSDIIEAYQDAEGQLVILGDPGAGKTTQALLLMRHLLDKASADPKQPVPELFVLASWAKTPDVALIDWLAAETRRRHGYPLAHAKALLTGHQIVPVLDGLDEVTPNHRPQCVEAINTFLAGHRLGPLVVCSRAARYRDLDHRLNIGAAVCVQPPDAEQVDHYLHAAGPSWDPVRRHLPEDEDLQRLLSTPLMLAVAVLAYQHDDPTELTQQSTGHRHLWSRYLTEMTTPNPVGSARPYNEQQVRRWLGWLAREMQAGGQSELWLHEWIGTRSFQWKVRLAIGIAILLLLTMTTAALTLALGFEFGFPLAVGLASALTGPLTADPVPQIRAKHFDWASGLIVGLVTGLISGLVFGRDLGLFGGLAAALIVGLGGLLGAGLIDPADRDQLQLEVPSDGYVQSARVGLGVGLAGGLIAGLSVGLLAGLAVGLGVGLVLGLGTGLGAGVSLGLTFGLGSAVFHLSWRRFYLRRRDLGPRRWPAFLAWCADRLLLFSTGPSYQWIHIELRDHLANGFSAAASTQERVAGHGSRRSRRGGSRRPRPRRRRLGWW
jgi:hypothetical protein